MAEQGSYSLRVGIVMVIGIAILAMAIFRSAAACDGSAAARS